MPEPSSSRTASGGAGAGGIRSTSSSAAHPATSPQPASSSQAPPLATTPSTALPTPSTFTTAPAHADKDKTHTTKKKQLGNWLFKKFGGSNHARGQQHGHTLSLDSSAHEHHRAARDAAALAGAGLNANGNAHGHGAGGGGSNSVGPMGGAAFLAQQTAATTASSRSRRPSFPRSRKGAAAQADGGGPGASSPATSPSGGGGGIDWGRRRGNSGSAAAAAVVARPASADAKSSSGTTGGGGGGMVSSFWRASHIDGVPTPSLLKGKGAAYLNYGVPSASTTAAAANGAGAGGGTPGASGLRPHASSPGLTDNLANTLVLPVSPPPRLPDPVPSPMDAGGEDGVRDPLDPLHLGAPITAGGRALVSDDEDDDGEDNGRRRSRGGESRRTGASSPAPSQTAYSIGTTSLGTDTSAPASSINSLVRIRNGNDLRNNGMTMAGTSSAAVQRSSALAAAAAAAGPNGVNVLDIPDGSTDRLSDVEPDTDSDTDSDRAWRRRRRYSGDDATMDTGKSVSTKPTTVMSIDTRDASGGPTMMAHIAQYRHGDRTSPSFGPQTHAHATGSHGGAGAGPSSSVSRNSAQLASGSASIQFADPATASPHLIRSTSMGTTTSGPGGGMAPGQGQPLEDAGPYVNVPSFSRPHPLNNPAPQGIPADNASMLTLASSTAAQSILGGVGGGGGAPSIHHPPTSSHHQQHYGPGSIRAGTHGRAPSVATRSLGGSLMGDRRNSSDTYASLKALPPLSRRGSDASTRTGLESVAAPSVNVHVAPPAGAVPGGAGAGLALGGPGAPSDRVGIGAGPGSLHRSPSMRTVNTQLSVPLSLAAAYQGGPVPAPAPVVPVAAVPVNALAGHGGGGGAGAGGAGGGTGSSAVGEGGGGLVSVVAAEEGLPGGEGEEAGGPRAVVLISGGDDEEEEGGGIVP
ncbi:hypothetical protein OC842_000692 [Tilletia horrida]|uniref:Uncharacterized protein n=1 Tax=Tilletia horrida TaxID=155126 RepID=A0AAN6GGC4_9BASI|nr:hypothetical protein OC842_000692 [Tilletia horrida]